MSAGGLSGDWASGHALAIRCGAAGRLSVRGIRQTAVGGYIWCSYVTGSIRV